MTHSREYDSCRTCGHERRHHSHGRCEETGHTGTCGMCRFVYDVTQERKVEPVVEELLTGKCYAFESGIDRRVPVLAYCKSVRASDAYDISIDPVQYISLKGCDVPLARGQLLWRDNLAYRVLSCDAVRNAEIRRLTMDEQRRLEVEQRE